MTGGAMSNPTCLVQAQRICRVNGIPARPGLGCVRALDPSGRWESVLFPSPGEFGWSVRAQRVTSGRLIPVVTRVSLEEAVRSIMFWTGVRPGPPCSCGDPDASWHGDPAGRREFLCDACASEGGVS